VEKGMKWSERGGLKTIWSGRSGNNRFNGV